MKFAAPPPKFAESICLCIFLRRSGFTKFGGFGVFFPVFPEETRRERPHHTNFHGWGWGSEFGSDTLSRNHCLRLRPQAVPAQDSSSPMQSHLLHLHCNSYSEDFSLLFMTIRPLICDPEVTLQTPKPQKIQRHENVTQK